MSGRRGPVIRWRHQRIGDRPHERARASHGGDDRSQARDRGSASVAALVLVFAFSAGTVMWLARDVDRSISHRTSAQSIAFQAARSGTQQLDVAQLRTEGGRPAVDPSAAREAAVTTAVSLFRSYGLDGHVVDVVVEGDRVEVVVTVTDSGRTVTGAAAARAEERS